MNTIHRLGAVSRLALISCLISGVGHAVTLTLTPTSPLSCAAPASPSFSFAIAAEQYVDANGETADDELHSYRIHVDGILLDRATGSLLNTTSYQGSFGDSATLSDGIYTYWVDVYGNHPEAFDNWIEGHEEDEHDNPDDPEEVTGWHWVDEHHEIGFNWSWNTSIAARYLRYIVGNAGPVFLTVPQSTTAAWGATARFVAYASGSQVSYTWQRLPAGGGAWTDVPLGNGYLAGWGGTGNFLSVAVTSASMNGDQFRCLATNSAGTTTSSIGTLTVIPALFDGGEEVVVSYLTPQQTAAAGSISFSMILSGHTYTAADGSRGCPKSRNIR